MAHFHGTQLQACARHVATRPTQRPPTPGRVFSDIQLSKSVTHSRQSRANVRPSTNLHARTPQRPLGASRRGPGAFLYGLVPSAKGDSQVGAANRPRFGARASLRLEGFVCSIVTPKGSFE